MIKTKEVDIKEGERTTYIYSGLVQQGYLHPARIGDGQKEVITTDFII